MYSKPKSLVLAPHYTTFIKDSIEACAPGLGEVSVMIHHNHLSEISKLLPSVPYFSYVRMFTKGRLVDYQNMPSNISINLMSFLYYPPDYRNKPLGDQLVKMVESRLKPIMNNFDLINAQFAWPMGYVGSRLKGRYKKPLVITAHGLDIYDLPFRDQDWMEKVRSALNSADQVITVSMANRKIIEKLDIDSPVTVIPNGYAGNMFHHSIIQQESRKALHLPEGKRILLTVGALETIKGHNYLIEAMPLVLEQQPDTILVVVGTGSLSRALKKKVEMAGLESKILFMGQRPHQEIPLWFSACDLFVLPSLDEGNPTVMFECLGSGRPFVGTRVGGIPEIIHEGDQGFLCPPRDPASLASAIVNGLSQDWDAEEITRYSKQFEWNHLKDAILEVYGRAIDGFGADR